MNLNIGIESLNIFKFKYVVVYVDEKKVYETKKKLMNAKGIKDIVDSQFELEQFDLLQNTQVL